MVQTPVYSMPCRRHNSHKHRSLRFELAKGRRPRAIAVSSVYTSLRKVKNTYSQTTTSDTLSGQADIRRIFALRIRMVPCSHILHHVISWVASLFLCIASVRRMLVSQKKLEPSPPADAEIISFIIHSPSTIGLEVVSRLLHASSLICRCCLAAKMVRQAL